MSIDATNWAWSQRDVTPTEKLILLSYADRAGETHEAWPSWSRLILDTGLDRKTIYYGLASLQKKGKMIKTGDKKGQVYIYRLIGVTSRESKDPPKPKKKLSTTRSKNGTGSKTGTSSENGTGTSSENGTTTSSKNGTKNHQLNLQRNPKGEKPLFSSFFSLEEFLIYIKELIAATNKQPLELLTEEVAYYADKFKGKRDQVESVHMALSLIKKGSWKTPHGFNGITSKSIREKDEQQEREKQERIQKEAQQDSKMVNAIKDAVTKGSHISIAERLKLLQQATNAN